MTSSRRRHTNSQQRRPVIDFLIGLAVGAGLAAACISEPAASAPSPPAALTRRVTPTTLSIEPAQGATTAPQPALTSMAVLARALTVTPSPAGPRVLVTATPTSGEMVIIVGDYYFKPQNARITAGTRVTWVPEGVLYHTIISRASPPVFSGGTAGSGTPTYEFTFRRAGLYDYHCDYHPGAMDAVIEVVDGS